MSFEEPTFVERFIDVVFNNLIGSRLYKSYINGLGVRPHDTVLDFGSGSGAGSRHIADILSKGTGKLTCVDMSKAWTEVARKRMRKYPNVQFKVGDIRTLDVEDAAYDVVLVHFILHDLEQDQRQSIVNALSRKLKAGGTLYIREPIKETHGMPPDEIRQLMVHGALNETEFKVIMRRIPGPIYAGVFVKTARHST